MRPHTRTHCNKKAGDCEGEAARCTRGSAATSSHQGRGGAALLGGHDHHVAALYHVSGTAVTTSGGSSVGVSASAVDSSNGGVDDGGGMRHYSLVELPAELLVKILEYIPFKEHSNTRLVSEN
jgi:hypothetical protein